MPRKRALLTRPAGTESPAVAMDDRHHRTGTIQQTVVGVVACSPLDRVIACLGAWQTAHGRTELARAIRGSRVLGHYRPTTIFWPSKPSRKLPRTAVALSPSPCTLTSGAGPFCKVITTKKSPSLPLGPVTWMASRSASGTPLIFCAGAAGFGNPGVRRRDDGGLVRHATAGEHEVLAVDRESCPRR